MIYKVRVQESIVRAWKAEDDGKDVFFMCTPGLEERLKRKLTYGEEFLIEIPIIRELKDE